MAEYYDNIEKATLENDDYRRVVATISNSMQLVLMSLLPNEEIGSEVHPYTTQFFRIEEGFGSASVNGKFYILKEGMSLVVPPGAEHNIRNISSTTKLKLYTIYSPPEHSPNTVQRTKPKDEHGQH